jgi:hypothetical protein
MFNFYLGHIKELTYNSEDSLQNLNADNMRGLGGWGEPEEKAVRGGLKR